MRELVPFIDHRGRVLGKWNVIDIAVLLLLLLMVPVGYGAYALFRAPVPSIAAIDPTEVRLDQPVPVRIQGEYLRAFLRVRVGDREGTLLIESPTRAEIRVPDNLPPGTYDVALFDEARELFRLPKALTLTAPPPPPPPPPAPAPPPLPEVEMQAVGAFVSLAPPDTRLIRVGQRVGRSAATASDGVIGQIVAVKPSEPTTYRIRVAERDTVTAPVRGMRQVPAILRLRCAIAGDQCNVGNTVLQQGVILPVSAPTADGAWTAPLQFRIDELRPSASPLVFPPPATATATIRVRLTALEEIIGLARAGDVDRRGEASLVLLAEQRQRVTGISSAGSVELPQSMVVVEGTFKVPTIMSSGDWEGAWQYAGRPLRAGETFAFETARYAVVGIITDVHVTAEAVPKP